jgi:NADP-dependent 3-hydroxy acid dehydrogenase YdfG
MDGMTPGPGAARLRGAALVTGGSRGIGRACALRLASEGADVALSYLENRDAAESVAEEIRGMGRRAAFFQADASDAAANAALVQGRWRPSARCATGLQRRERGLGHPRRADS